MQALLEFIRKELVAIRIERLASPGCKGQDYWRGYRDALRAVREEVDLLNKEKL